MMTLACTLVATVAFFLLVPVLFFLVRILGVYTIVREKQCQVFTLFGNVVAIIDEPGLHFLIGKMGLKALVIRLIGKLYVIERVGHISDETPPRSEYRRAARAGQAERRAG
jgi:hypothetical protein